MSFRLVIPVVFFLFSLVCLAPLSNGADRGPQIVVSIQPLHSLVAGVMKGVGAPYLLLKGRQSPHHFQLKPSDARVLAGRILSSGWGRGLRARCLG